jgi:trigger factor
MKARKRNPFALTGTTMQVQETLSQGLARGFKVTVPADQIERRLEGKLKELGAKVRIAGFRPGKVPVSILRKRYAMSVMGEVVQEAVAESSTVALAERELRPAMQPKIEIVNFEPEPLTDLEYSMEFEILPAITAPDFSKVQLTRKKAELDDKAVNDGLQRLADNNKESKTLDVKRGAKSGDVVLIDFAGTVGGVAKDGMKGDDFELELGSGTFIPGFEDQLEGQKAGDERVITVTFPETYHEASLQGAEAEFTVKLKEIREKTAPALDDELAKKMGLETITELKDIVREQLQKEYDRLSREALKRDLLDQLFEMSDFDVPEGLVDAEFKQIWANIEHAKQHGHLPEEDEGKDDDTLKAEYRDIAKRRVRLGLLLSDVGTKARVDVRPEEINRALFDEARRYPGQEKAVLDYYRNNPQALTRLKAPLFEEKVVDYILEMASIDDKIVSFEDLVAEPGEAAASMEKPAKKAKTAEKAEKAEKPAKKAKADKEDKAEKAEKKSAKKPAAKKSKKDEG